MRKKLLVVLTEAMALVALGGNTIYGLNFTELKAPTEITEKNEDGDYSRYQYFHHGSPVWRCRIENTSNLSRTLQVVLNAKDFEFFRNHDNDLKIISALTLDAKQTKTAEFHLPFIDGSVNRQFYLAINVGDQTVYSTIRDGLTMNVGCDSQQNLDMPSPRFLGADYNPLIAISEELNRNEVFSAYATTWQEECHKENRHNTKYNDEQHPDLDVRICDFSRFTEWRDFSVVSAVVIGPKTWTKLGDATRRALKGYIVAGGSVILVGEDFPEDAPSAGIHALGEVAHFKALDKKSVMKDGVRFAELVAKGARNLQFVTDPKGTQLPCGVASMAEVEAELEKAPFGTIILILVSFVLLAGPVLVIYLARTNRRIHLLWVFPSIAVVFTAIVVGVLIEREGFSPRIKNFTHTASDAEFGMSVTVEDTVLVAPIPLSHAIDLPADALVSFDGGNRKVCGETIIIDKQGYHFMGTGWAPSLWPVRFRSVRVEGGAR